MIESKGSEKLILGQKGVQEADRKANRAPSFSRGRGEGTKIREIPGV